MRKITYILFILLFPSVVFAQNDSIKTKLTFTGDFRFRIEQDWNSRKSNGDYRDDRTRLRYRARFGANYQYNQWAAFGLRLRTGNPRKQQDPQLTLGEGLKEFSTLPIGFEKIFFKAKYKGLIFWVGKNTFPFAKQNELFWSDNIYPEGIFLSHKFQFQSKFLQDAQIKAGHFIVAANGSSFNNDSYFQGIQIHTRHWSNNFELFPSFYNFKNTPNVPDGNETYILKYSIFHLGAKLRLSKKPVITLGFDYYYNFEDLQANDSIPYTLNDQNKGITAAVTIGKLEDKGDWMLKVTYTHLQQYAIVDFLAQNDWARWDYASSGSPDGRLSNFKGLEIKTGYAFDKKNKCKY